MYGVDVQNLTFSVERLRVTPVGYESYGLTTVATYTGNLGDIWRRAVLNVRSAVGAGVDDQFRMRIAAGTNGDAYGDVAIDSISFGACPGTGDHKSYLVNLVHVYLYLYAHFTSVCMRILGLL